MDRGLGRRTVRLLAACLLVGLGLTACSGDDPAPTPSASVQPAETSTPEVTATPPPLLIGQPTAASAVAFVKYFIDAYNYAYASYDTSILEDISQPSCQYCQSVVKDVAGLRDSRVRIAGTGVSLVEALPTNEAIKDDAVVATVINQAPGTRTAADGRVTQLVGAKQAHVEFGLDWDGGKWLIRGARVLAKGTPWHA